MARRRSSTSTFYRRSQPGQTHAQACLLDHVAEMRNILDAFPASAAPVTVTMADETLERADDAWGEQRDPAT